MTATLPLDADVIIVGAGPAGMTAAAELAVAGSSVIVLDMNAAPGGQIYRGLEANSVEFEESGEFLTALGSTYRDGLPIIERFRAACSIDYRPGTTVWEVRADGTVGWLREDEAGYLRARHVVLANGAMERPTPFPGWTLPGVMTAGAVQTLLKAGRLKPSGRVVLAGTGPLLVLLAQQLLKLGITPVLMARTDSWTDSLRAGRHLRASGLAPITKGLGWLIQLRLSKMRFASSITGLEAIGDTRVEAVSFRSKGRRVTERCDLLVVHDGVVPSIDLAHGAGLELEWDGGNASLRPVSSKDGQATSLDGVPCRVRVSGDARRIGGADAAAAHGKHIAAAILHELGLRSPEGAADTEGAVERTLAARPFLDAAFPPGVSADALTDDTIICRCEELTAGTLRRKISDGAREMNQLRGETRCGMGPCQGRNCTVTLVRLLREAGGPLALPARSSFRARPPARPIPLGALAALTGLDPDAAKLETLEDKPETGLVGAGDPQDV